MTDPSAAIYKHFEKVTDPRINRGANHSLLDMIFVALTATICGSNGWADVERFGNSKLDWFRQYIDLEHGVPSHDTFGRVFSRLNTGEFLDAMHSWVDSFAESLRGKGVAIDGKALRGSIDRSEGIAALHTITAFACETRTVLRQMSVEKKSNEIPAVPKLLELLELSGAVVTLDALHCQTATAKAIVDRDATYILTVKGNQPTLYEELLNRFDAYLADGFKVDGLKKHVTVERSHGRKERREYYVKAIEPNDALSDKWVDLKSIGMVYRQREEKGELQHETMFFITNHAPKVKTLARHLRDHWSIENSQHWVLDVTFAEDASRIRKGSAPEIAGAFRRMALTILQRDITIKENIRGKRLRAGWDENVLDQIYAGFTAI
jgi:predicted transposase YbfD/YdcC